MNGPICEILAKITYYHDGLQPKMSAGMIWLHECTVWWILLTYLSNIAPCLSRDDLSNKFLAQLQPNPGSGDLLVRPLWISDLVFTF